MCPDGQRCICENAGEKRINEIVEEMRPKIKSRLRNTFYQEREDLEQELKIKVSEAVDKFEDKEIPGFCEFLMEKKTMYEEDT